MNGFKYVIKYVDTITLFIIFAAVTHGLVQWKLARDGGKTFQFLDFIIAAFIAGFTGAFFARVSLIMQLDTDVVVVVAGAGGFLGLAGMNYIVEVGRLWVLKKLGLKGEDG